MSGIAGSCHQSVIPGYASFEGKADLLEEFIVNLFRSTDSDRSHHLARRDDDATKDVGRRRHESGNMCRRCAEEPVRPLVNEVRNR